ncbi:MAG: tetratricopeptide repeat protein [Microbacterium sp.]|uniref:tetratricopeptide repeat protein n=1 Tax=Microbacterium sp. TaxID=51671 RepID=UPI001AD46C48|nr:tetratricopeptide repeat protein [Microbacterium sp.]MBN9177234.1 tetratricopeptide repeat protein [Microbacterium sp.]
MSEDRTTPPHDGDERFDAFWADVDLVDADAARRALASLLAERGLDDARAAYERGSLHDSLGEEAEAVPLYRAALAEGLDPSLQTQATIQLASTLRNLGDASGAIALLQAIPADDPLTDAARAFLALALFDDGKPAPALRTALQTLAPRLPRYQRAVGAYAGELQNPDRIRAIAVGLLVQDGWVLAEEYAGSAQSGSFLRAPGGGVEFGERADDAVRREFAEELGVTLDEARLLGVTENIFDAHGKRGHEIVSVYGIRCAELEALPRGARLDVQDADTSVGWYRIDALPAPFYPVGCLQLAV